MITAFIVLNLLGIIDTAFLLYKRIKKTPLVCPLNHDCKAVLDSRWSHLFGIPNETLGLLFYLLTLTLAFGSIHIQQTSTIIRIVTFGGALYSTYLAGIQIIRLKNFCLYCLISALISLLLFLLSWGLPTGRIGL
ncbi:hypothetical protein HYW61_00700 [candidate division WWE3 bacterium]|nr:hypothetical protein [candidate division WWE3 bacterium]